MYSYTILLLLSIMEKCYQTIFCWTDNITHIFSLYVPLFFFYFLRAHTHDCVCIFVSNSPFFFLFQYYSIFYTFLSNLHLMSNFSSFFLFLFAYFTQIILFVTISLLYFVALLPLCCCTSNNLTSIRQVLYVNTSSLH